MKRGYDTAIAKLQEEKKEYFNQHKKAKKVNKNEIKAFDSYDIENNDIDFWGNDCQEKNIDNFVDKLFSNDPFEESGFEEYEGFDPSKLDKDNPFIQCDIEDNKVIADLNELREITKNTFEKFKNKINKIIQSEPQHLSNLFDR